ncbi:MAG: ATP-binding protein [Patescibacteria group bacterium]
MAENSPVTDPRNTAQSASPAVVPASKQGSSPVPQKQTAASVKSVNANAIKVKTAAEIEAASKQKQTRTATVEVTFKPLPNEVAKVAQVPKQAAAVTKTIRNKTTAEIEAASNAQSASKLAAQSPAAVSAPKQGFSPVPQKQAAANLKSADATVIKTKTVAEIEAASKQKQIKTTPIGTVFKPLPNEVTEVAQVPKQTAAKVVTKTIRNKTAAEIEAASNAQPVSKLAAQSPAIAVRKQQAVAAKGAPRSGSPVTATTTQSKQAVSIRQISAANPGAKELPTFAATKAVSAKPVPANPGKPQVTGDQTATEQYLNHNQKATGSFLRKIFEKAKQTVYPTPGQSVTKNPEQKKFVEAERIYQQGLASVKDLISPSSLEIHYDHLNLSGVYMRSFFVYAYPRFLETNWLSPVINFDATVDMAQFIYPISSDEIMHILKKKVAQIQSSITMQREKGNVRDPVLETALEDAEQLRTDLQRGQEKFFQFGFYFTVYADDLKKLEATTKMLENQLGGKLVLTKRADIQGEHAFNSTLPICVDELEVHRNMNTSPLSTTFPFVSSTLATDEGILYGLNRHNNSLIIFDRFALPNANSCVFASSGAGKSYAVKLEILRQAMFGTDMIVIDPENEYEALCETMGGTYLQVSLNSNQRINPFDLPKPFEGDDLKPGDLLRENVITLTALMKLMLGKMTSTEEALIDKALIDTYAVKGITMKVEDPNSVAMPTMEDFHSVLSSTKGAEDLAQRLQKYTSGTFGGIFNKETNVDLNSGVVVFCIRDLEDELRPTAMFIILNYIWNRVRSEMKKRLLVVDEAWILMQHEDAAKFLFGLVKRARKYYLGITAITQDVEDFLGSSYGRPIVTNSSMQLLLKQAPSSMDVLQKTFNLTDGEKYMLLNSGMGQGLFFADNKHVAIQVIASYSENQIVTTNPEEVLAQREAQTKGFKNKSE